MNSTGTASSVSLSFTGNIIGFSGFNNPSSDTLRKDYLFLNSSNNSATSALWELTGLRPGDTYAFFVYGSNASNSDWTIGVNGSDKTVSGASGTAYYPSVVASSTGTIGGVFAGIGPVGNEGDWAGFQLADLSSKVTSAPEPASIGLFCAGLGLLSVMRRRKRV